MGDMARTRLALHTDKRTYEEGKQNVFKCGRHINTSGNNLILNNIEYYFCKKCLFFSWPVLK